MHYPPFHSSDTQAGTALEQAAAVPAGQLARLLPVLPTKEAECVRTAKEVEAANAALEDAHEAQSKSREELDKLEAVRAGRGANVRRNLRQTPLRISSSSSRKSKKR